MLPTIRRTGGYATPAPVPVPAPVETQGLSIITQIMKNPAVAIELIGHYAAANLTLTEKVAADAPAVAFAEAVADSDELYGLQEAGKALQQKPLGFCDWLRARGDIYRRAGSLCFKQHLIDRGLFVVRWKLYGSTPRPETRLTGKGIVFYAKLLGVRPPQRPRQPLLPGV